MVLWWLIIQPETFLSNRTKCATEIASCPISYRYLLVDYQDGASTRNSKLSTAKPFEFTLVAECFWRLVCTWERLVGHAATYSTALVLTFKPHLSKGIIWSLLMKRKITSIKTVRHFVFSHPMVHALAALGCNPCHHGDINQIHLNPLPHVQVQRWPRACFAITCHVTKPSVAGAGR